MKSYPALDIRSDDVDLLYAVLDDLAPTAIEELDRGLRAFFDTADARDRALQRLAGRYAASPIDVPDEDWARRSQANLSPIVVGRLAVIPFYDGLSTDPQSELTHARIQIAIKPSMGFGTGHHATTRLCLAAMQSLDLEGKAFVDVGTGSGVLALAAARLGARATGLDVDPDALQSARENQALNPCVEDVSFVLADLAIDPLPPADVLAANLTGAILIRSARKLLAAVAAGGALILSGIMRHERDDVGRAFESASVVWEQREDEWVGLVMKKA